MSGWDPNYFLKDEETLKELGYRQQLIRNLGPLENFGISFSIIAVPVTVTALFGYCFATGGPGTMIISWIVVSFFSFLVALSMAEIVSALPTSGGPYYWAATLAPSKYSAFASWVTAWFNMFGLVSSNTGSSYALAQLISTAMSAKFNYIPTKEEKIGIVAAVLLSWLIMNTIGRSFLRHLLYISVSLNSVGLIALAVSVLVKAPTHQPASFVFTGFVDNSGPTPDHGWSTLISPAYVVFIGSYMGLTSFFGYEASAHLAEETIRAAWTAPFGIITSVGFSAFFGLLLITALLFSIQDLSIFTSPRYDNPVLEILIDIFGKNGGLLLFALPIWGCWFCGLYSTMSNSRLIWAFSRDRGIPHFFSTVNERFMSPIWAVALSTVLSFLLSLFSLWSNVVLTAATSIAIIAVLISYGIPILLRLIYHRKFSRRNGPFRLGFASRTIALVSVGWIILSSIILCLPTYTPITMEKLNYSPIALAFISFWVIGIWLLRARNSFVGPLKSWSPSDLSNLMMDSTKIK